MAKCIFDHEHSTGSARRSVLKVGTLAAIGMILDPLSDAQPAKPPLDYGVGSGQTHLDSTNLFPLLAAWVLLTTSGPTETTDPATIASVANISSASAQTVFSKFTNNQQAFSTVRQAFSELAKAFAIAPPYSGGQCPESAMTIAPMASLPCSMPGPAKTPKHAK